MIYLFSQKMLENLFNYATSFAASPMDMRQKPGIIRKAKPDLQQYSLNLHLITWKIFSFSYFEKLLETPVF